jgi:hypothetical protein
MNPLRVPGGSKGLCTVQVGGALRARACQCAISFVCLRFPRQAHDTPRLLLVDLELGLSRSQLLDSNYLFSVPFTTLPNGRIHIDLRFRIHGVH